MQACVSSRKKFPGNDGFFVLIFYIYLDFYIDFLSSLILNKQDSYLTAIIGNVKDQ